MSSFTSLAVLPLGVALLVVLAGCSAEEPPVAAPTASATQAPEPTPTPDAVKLAFTMPTDCNAMVPQSRIDAFTAEGIILLGGPGGKYADYLSDATPEEQAGGISCIWGFAPLTPATRPDVVASFGEQGLNEQIVGDGVAYGVQGDRTLDPAIMNVLRGESWISVIATIGGTDSYNQSVEIAQEVHDSVYTAG